jgi:ribosomal-protein-alanine N-acetyltransferase
MSRIRPADPDDLPALRAIQTATLAEPWPELLALGVDGPPILLVYADPDPAGYALAIAGASDHPATTGDAQAPVEDQTGIESDGHAAYIVELAVAPARQGSGIGTTLVESLVARLRGEEYDRLYVTARAVDEDVLDFYEQRGFERDRRLPDHYDSGDGVLLSRLIGSTSQGSE